MKIQCVAPTRAQLGEGPVWDEARGLVWWLDIRSASLHRHDVATGRNEIQPLECRLTALALTHRNEFIACGDRGFVRLSVGADLRVHFGPIIAAPQERAGNRFNDGKVDERGRFWAGTMDDAELGAYGALYRLDAERGVERIRTDLSVPNGPCFLADGTVLTTDSPQRLITGIALDDDGEPIGERVFARFTAAQGYPDGMTVDADNHVWVAFWDGWCLRRLSPRGNIVAEVPLPVQRPTCPVFGGADLNYLYVTSASAGLTAAALARQPMAGSLLRCKPGVRGRVSARFRD